MTASTDTYVLTLALHGYDVPCIMQLDDPPCEVRAQWVAYFRHFEDTDCVATAAPLCPQHKRNVQMAQDPFWQQWTGAEPVECDKCGRPVELDRFEPIRKPS